MAPSESVLAKVARTCKESLPDQAHVTINTEALSAKASDVSKEVVQRACKAFRYPCKFESQEEEITFMAILRLLDFGSGYNDLLEKQGKNSKDVVQMGVIGMHISSKPTDAAGLMKVSRQDVISLFGVDSHEDCDSGIPGVTMSKPGGLAPWTKLLQESLVMVGEALEEEDQPSLGALIVNVLKDQQAAKKAPSASGLVSELIDSVPGFVDAGLVEKQQVVFHRKVQLLVVDLYMRFHAEDPRFDFVDMAALSADSGSSVIAVLREWNILTCSEDLQALVSAGQNIHTGAQERAMRAACVECVRQLADACEGLEVWELSRWMSHTADLHQIEGLKPHLTKGIESY